MERPRDRLNGGRRVDVAVDVLALSDRTFALLDQREEITLTDLEHGTIHEVRTRAGEPVYGPCGGTVAALPTDARELLTLPWDGHGQQTAATLPAERLQAFDRALLDGGWESGTIEIRDFDGATLGPYWRGPCAAAFEGDAEIRTEADWHDGHLAVRERACD